MISQLHLYEVAAVEMENVLENEDRVMKEDVDEAVLCSMCKIIYFQNNACDLHVCLFRVSERDFRTLDSITTVCSSCDNHMNKNPRNN